MRGQIQWQGAMQAEGVSGCAGVRIGLGPRHSSPLQVSAMGNAKNLEQRSRLDLQLF